MTDTNNRLSTSKILFMCGPAGSGKSTIAKSFETKGMTRLSFDEESFRRGITTHPLSESTAKEIKDVLDKCLISLIKKNKDVVLDYSFWSKEMRAEYITLLKKYRIEPTIYYIQTPKDIVLERIRKRKGDQANEIMLDEKIANVYYDDFEPPTSDEGKVIVVKGY